MVAVMVFCFVGGCGHDDSSSSNSSSSSSSSRSNSSINSSVGRGGLLPLNIIFL